MESTSNTTRRKLNENFPELGKICGSKFFRKIKSLVERMWNQAHIYKQYI